MASVPVPLSVGIVEDSSGISVTVGLVQGTKAISS